MRKQSFGGGLLKKKAHNEFEDWPLEDLVDRLREDGVDVPPDSNPHDLVAFASVFYADAEDRPRRRTIPEVDFTDASGVEYMTRPANRKTQTRKNNHFSDLDFHYATEPPMFDEEMTDEERKRYNHARDSRLNANDLGGHFMEEEIETVEHEEDDDGMREIRENFGFLEHEEATQRRIRSEFQRPSLDVAKRFETLNHPRRLTGKKYSVCFSNTGRFCFTRGRGLFRFIDPFGEGSTSELARYGIGIRYACF
jgi:hypothetical protein